ncbi:MAG: YbjN domain-containing protein [Bacteroidales bacterium]|nr:YbjN domain-containing protein [Bacteroidales bacterium]
MEMDWITPDTVSIEVIRDIYDAAYLDVILLEETQQLSIRDEIKARATLAQTNERLQLLAYYEIQPDATRADRLELANRINDRFVLIRAGVDEEGDLWFDYTVLLKGGVTKKMIVQATRVFLMLVPRAVQECDEDNIIA